MCNDDCSFANLSVRVRERERAIDARARGENLSKAWCKPRAYRYNAPSLHVQRLSEDRSCADILQRSTFVVFNKCNHLETRLAFGVRWKIAVHSQARLANEDE